MQAILNLMCHSMGSQCNCASKLEKFVDRRLEPWTTTTSEIHFIISKMVSAVRADATEVPMPNHKSSSTNGLPATGP